MTQAIILCGSIEDGYSAHGPYDSINAAQAVAHAGQLVVELEQDESNVDPEGNIIVVGGNLFDGYHFVGPFSNEEDADQCGDHDFEGEWWRQLLVPPGK